MTSREAIQNNPHLFPPPLPVDDWCCPFPQMSQLLDGAMRTGSWDGHGSSKVILAEILQSTKIFDFLSFREGQGVIYICLVKLPGESEAASKVIPSKKL